MQTAKHCAKTGHKKQYSHRSSTAMRARQKVWAAIGTKIFSPKSPHTSKLDMMVLRYFILPGLASASCTCTCCSTQHSIKPIVAVWRCEFEQWAPVGHATTWGMLLCTNSSYVVMSRVIDCSLSSPLVFWWFFRSSQFQPRPHASASSFECSLNPRITV